MSEYLNQFLNEIEEKSENQEEKSNSISENNESPSISQQRANKEG